MAFHGDGADHHAFAVKQRYRHGSSTRYPNKLGQRAMRHCDCSLQAGQGWMADGAALVHRLFHCVLDGVDDATAILERGGMRKGREANPTAPTAKTNRYAITAQTACKIIGNSNRHAQQSWLLAYNRQEIQA